MNLFFDTSALIKYFHTEDGSNDVISLVDDIGNSIFISEVTKVEFTNSFYRKLRMGETNISALQSVFSIFNEKLKGWSVDLLGSMHVSEANRLIEHYGKSYSLRTLDALQLASFNSLDQGEPEFVLADKALNDVALAMGIKTRFIE